MGRKAKETVVEDHSVTPKEADLMQEMGQAVNGQIQAKAAYTEERDLANRMLGRLEMADNFAKVATVASLVELKKVKEDKLFKYLSNPSTGDAVRTWDEYCQMLGKSRRTIDEQLQNLQVFGEEAIESMNHIGFGVRQLRQLRKLPDDEMEQAKQLAQENDKESLLELIEEQAVKHQKEKEKLQTQLDEKQNIYDALDKDYHREVERGRKARAEVDKLEKKAIDMTAADLANELTQELEVASAGVNSALIVLQKCIKDISDAAGLARIPEDTLSLAFASTQRFKARVSEIQDMFGLHAQDVDDDLNENGIPVWLGDVDEELLTDEAKEGLKAN